MKETVKVELLKDPECLMGFSCGEPSIDELIKKAYYETLLEKGYTYVAILNDRVIAVWKFRVKVWMSLNSLSCGRKNVSTQKNRKYDTEWYTKRDFSAWTKVACSFYNY